MRSGDPGGPHRLEHVGGGDCVLLEVPARVLESVADIRVCRRWKTQSQPLNARSITRSVRTSPLYGVSRGRLVNCEMNSCRPVEKLSTTTTSTPLARSRSAKFEPMNPAPP